MADSPTHDPPIPEEIAHAIHHGYRAKLCPICGVHTTNFEGVAFAYYDQVEQTFSCPNGHTFYAIFRLAEIVPEAGTDLSTIRLSSKKNEPL